MRSYYYYVILRHVLSWTAHIPDEGMASYLSD